MSPTRSAFSDNYNLLNKIKYYKIKVTCEIVNIVAIR